MLNAFCTLGTMFYQGSGVPQDFKKSFEYYREAAQRGSQKAQFNLGVMYSKGQGVAQDMDTAKLYFEQSKLTPTSH